MEVTTIHAEPRAKEAAKDGNPPTGAKALSDAKPAPDRIDSLDSMKKLTHIVKALHGAKAANKGGAALREMIAAAERRMESPISVNVRGCMALINFCSQIDGEERRRLLALAGKAYVQLPEKGRVLGRLGLPSPRQMVDINMKKALANETAMLREVRYTKTVGRMREQLALEEASAGNMALVSHTPSGDGSQIRFLANVLEAVGKAKGEDAPRDCETLDMLQKAVLAAWERGKGVEHFDEETRFACVRALAENNETELRFWYLLLGDSSEKIAGYVTEKMLGIADQEGVEFSGWMLIKKKVNQFLEYGHVDDMDRVLRRVASSGGDDANGFIESLDAKMLGLLADIVVMKAVKIQMPTAECVSGLLDCEEKREAALLILRGARSLPDGRTMELARGGNITAVGTVATVEPETLKVLLKDLFDNKTRMIVRNDGKDEERLGWVCAGERMLYHMEPRVRLITAEFLFETRKDAGWRTIIEKRGLEDIAITENDGWDITDNPTGDKVIAEKEKWVASIEKTHVIEMARRKDELLCWALDGKRPAALRRIALMHVRERMKSKVSEKAYAKIVNEAARGDATAATKLTAIRIIAMNRKLDSEDAPAIMEIARNGKPGLSLDAMIALHRCGVELPAELVKSRYLLSKLGVERKLTALMPDLAPSLGGDRQVIEKMRWSLPEDQVNGAAAIARYAKSGSRMAEAVVDEMLGYAREASDGDSIEEFTIAAKMACVLQQNGVADAGKVLWDDVIPEMTGILLEERSMQKKESGRIFQLAMMLMPQARHMAHFSGERQETARNFLAIVNRRIRLVVAPAKAVENATQSAKAVAGKVRRREIMLS